MRAVPNLANIGSSVTSVHGKRSIYYDRGTDKLHLSPRMLIYFVCTQVPTLLQNDILSAAIFREESVTNDDVNTERI